jgi:hypothetical protein
VVEQPEIGASPEGEENAGSDEDKGQDNVLAMMRLHHYQQI